jgi:UDP-N-acetylglucosamine--N-acetylmuramyl-(pentapeptide) pyrophosphoryl-undecaprenol N-acetylglucosamine transferase
LRSEVRDVARRVVTSGGAISRTSWDNFAHFGGEDVRVLLAGGGTAGHTSPLLATADALRRLDAAAEITCLGTPRGIETRVVPEAGYPLELIPPVPLPRRPNADFFKVPVNLQRAVQETYAVLDRVRPDVVVGYGGYVSMPAYLAARRRKLPLVVHEQNALPGLANKAGARFATRVAVSFPDTDLPRAEYVGLPIRRMISQLDRAALREEARAFFGLRADLPTLVVTGGSQGARRLNQSVSGAAEALGAACFQVLLVVGPKGEATPTPTSSPYVFEH